MHSELIIEGPMHTTISGLPAGAKVFEVANWHEGELMRIPEGLARLRLITKWLAAPQIIAYEQREELGR